MYIRTFLVRKDPTLEKDTLAVHSNVTRNVEGFVYSAVTDPKQACAYYYIHVNVSHTQRYIAIVFPFTSI